MSSGSASAAAAAGRLVLLRSLCRANDALLGQKLGLLEALTTSHGPARAAALFGTPSTVVGGATIGQHYRHSLDHVGRAVGAARQRQQQQQRGGSGGGHNPALVSEPMPPLVLPYDRRERGGPDEADMNLAKERIRTIQQDVRSLQGQGSDDGDGNGEDAAATWAVADTPVVAEFMLSGDSSREYPLPSTVARELGFGVHHAIHHMAMVRVLVLNEAWLTADQLDPAFGRAPSTLNYDRAGRRR